MRLAPLSSGASVGVSAFMLRDTVGVPGWDLSVLALVSIGVTASLTGGPFKRSTEEGTAVSENTRELLENKIRLHVSGNRVNV